MFCPIITEEVLLNWSHFLRAVLTLALPIAMQNLLATTASMVDTIMIGSRGELSVAAVGICSQITSLFFSLYFGFANGGLLFFSQYWGEQNHKGINRAFGVSFMMMLAIGLIFGGICVFAPEFLLGIYTDKKNIIEIGIPYIRIVGFSYPLMVISALIGFLMRSTERVKAPLISSFISLGVNFILNWILIYGRFGFPEMGASGAAVGTLVSSVVNLLMLCIFLVKSDCEFKLKLNEMFFEKDTFFGLYMGKCFPILCNEILYGVGQMLINIVIGRQAESAIAAMAAFRVLEGFVYAFFGGLADASSVVVGKEVGSGNHMKGFYYMKGFSFLCPVITFTICLICTLFNRPLLSLFGLGEEALMYGKYMLIIYLFAGAIRTCNYIMNCCFRAGGETVYGTVVEIGCLFAISVPATMIAGLVLKLPFLAVFSFVYTDELIRFVIELRYTNSGKWIKPVTDRGKESLPAFHRELAEKRK